MMSISRRYLMIGFAATSAAGLFGSGYALAVLALSNTPSKVAASHS